MNQENFAQLLEQSFVNAQLKPGTIIRGTVVSIDKEYVMINAGLKSEGAISREQFEDARGELEVSLGDEVDVALEMIEDGYGETRLSREKAKRAEAWRQLQEIFDVGEKVSGIVSSRIKGGFNVDLFGLKAFLPGSLVGMRHGRDASDLEGQECEFKIIKMDRQRNNVVLSRRAVLQESLSEERSTLLENLTEGAEVEGVVKNLTDYGAFVDLGGIDGLLHITDMSWKRIKHPSELISKDQTIKVKILKLDRENSRVSLGMKQLSGDPWQGVDQKYPVGTRLHGKVTNIAEYGCFVEIAEGIEGLVHMSEMDWSNKNVQPSKLVSLDQEVEVVILEIDSERRRISLGMKQCVDNPWVQFAEQHKKGERITGTIRSITDFGVFVGLSGEIDGLVHMSDIAWDAKESEQKIRQLSKGDTIEVVILAIEADRERVSLGMKQLSQDPFQEFSHINEKGGIVKGKVFEIDKNKGLRLELAEGVFGYIKASDNPSKNFAVGDEVEAKIMGVDSHSRELQLSIKALDAVDAKVLKGINQDVDQAGRATLGDLFKPQDKENL